jgi:hypothetical protein
MSTAVLKIRNKTVPFIVDVVRSVITHLTGNATYATPNPPLAGITTQANLLDATYQQALSRDKTLKALVKIAKAELFSMMTALTSYVQTTSLGDEAKILSAGFLVKGKPVKLGMLPPPSNFRSDFGLHPGEIILRWKGVHGHKNYLVQMSTDPGNPALWADVPDGLTGKTRLEVTGLETGKRYYFRVFTICTAGISGPSELANHIAA